MIDNGEEEQGYCIIDNDWYSEEEEEGKSNEEVWIWRREMGVKKRV